MLRMVPDFIGSHENQDCPVPVAALHCIGPSKAPAHAAFGRRCPGAQTRTSQNVPCKILPSPNLDSVLGGAWCAISSVTGLRDGDELGHPICRPDDARWKAYAGSHKTGGGG